MSKPTLYYLIESAPSRLVLLIANVLGIQLELIPIDPAKQEHLKSEFVSKNPFHAVPTLVDVDGFTVWESRAIASYLVQSRAPGSTLYPANLKQRITVDKILYYDTATLFRALSDIMYAYLIKQGDPVEKIQRAREVLKTLNEYVATLPPANFIANTTEISLADLAVYVTLDYLDVIDIDLMKEFPNIAAWYQRVDDVVARGKYDPDGAIQKGRAAMKMFYEKELKDVAQQQKQN